MKTIDFLPDIYRQRETLRRARVWWVIVILIFGGATGSAATAQAWLRHRLRNQLDELAPQFATAQTQVRELADLQIQIAKAAHEASLFTYLKHPWPRTQLLAEVVRPLPSAIRLTELHIGEEELPRSPTQAGPRRATAEEAAKQLTAEQDLLRLAADTDYRQTIVIIQGTTTNDARLHDYVAAVSRSPLVVAATIKSLEAGSEKQAAATQFTLRLAVKAGYGQRGNEGTPPANSAAKMPPSVARSGGGR
jgi:hypothetical protein